MASLRDLFLADIYEILGAALYPDTWTSRVLVYKNNNVYQAYDASAFMRPQAQAATVLPELQQFNLSDVNLRTASNAEIEQYERLLSLISKSFNLAADMHVRQITGGPDARCPSPENWGADWVGFNLHDSSITTHDGGKWIIVTSRTAVEQTKAKYRHNFGTRKNRKGGRKPEYDWDNIKRWTELAMANGTECKPQACFKKVQLKLRELGQKIPDDESFRKKFIEWNNKGKLPS